MLTTVTITGADDRTDPAALCKLSAEFPFVEWAFLLSASRFGTPRYPSRSWLMETEEVLRATHVKYAGHDHVRYAVHFCGQCTRDTMAGDCKWLDDISPGRVQLNGFNMPPTPDFLALAKETSRQRPLRFILQARELASFEPVVATAAEIGADVLYDPSGGRGIETAEWPKLPSSSVYLGYAGGIGPDNVGSVLDVLLSDQSRGDFWIDMESRVRTDDKLDLALVRDVLVKARLSGSGPAKGEAFEDYPDVHPKEHCQ
jgi:hypothetical protein